MLNWLIQIVKMGIVGKLFGWLKERGPVVRLAFSIFSAGACLAFVFFCLQLISRINEPPAKSVGYLALIAFSVVVIYIFGFCHGWLKGRDLARNEIEQLKKERDALKKESSEMARLAGQMQELAKDVSERMEHEEELLKRAAKEIHEIRSNEKREEFHQRIRNIQDGLGGWTKERAQQVRELLSDIQRIKGNEQKKKETKFRWPWLKKKG